MTFTMIALGTQAAATAASLQDLVGTWISEQETERAGPVTIVLDIEDVRPDGAVLGTQRNKTARGEYGPWDLQSSAYEVPARAREEAGVVTLHFRRKSSSAKYMDMRLQLNEQGSVPVLKGRQQSPHWNVQKVFHRQPR